jgi:phosphate-selective porin OprO/OprP
VCFSKFDEKGKSLMIRKHFAGSVASALALGVSAQAFAGTVVSVSAVETKIGEIV